MAASLEAAIARIYSDSGSAIGAGFLVSDKYVLTCAHVVNLALGIRADTPNMPTGKIYLDFPRVDAGRKIEAKVIFWLPVNPDCDREDIAGLELLHPIPDNAHPVRLVNSEDLWEHQFRVFGFPEGKSNGVWASGVLRGRTANEWVQLEDVKETGYRLDKGFSGAPVWDEELQGIVGMAVAAEQQRQEIKVAFIIPANVLVQAWEFLGERAIASCPYRGLFAFREEDAQFFFGRKVFTEQLVAEVAQRQLVAVIGASGSGKSSVVFAGLVPQLREQGRWLIESFRPGDRPFRNLAARLIPLLEGQMSETDRLAEVKKLTKKLDEGELVIGDVIERILEKRSGERLLLVADQFEELYTLCREDAERQRFLDGLLEARDRVSRLTLVLTLRADFLSYALSYRPFADALQNADVKLAPMNKKELREVVELRKAVELPAEQELKVRLESGLTERILEDVERSPGNLPLLEFALEQLWGRQENGSLTHKAYDEIGGVEKGLAQYAEEGVYKKLGEEDKEKAQRVFIQLVRPGEGTEDTRRLATRGEVGEENWDLVTRLASDRLVVTSCNETNRETVEVIHEALIREWGTLRQWMNDNREFRTWQERLRAKIQEWKATRKYNGALLQGPSLVEAKYWQQKQEKKLSSSDLNFIKLSLDIHNKKKNLQRGIIAGLVILLAVAVGLWQNSERQRKEILGQKLLAQAEQLSNQGINEWKTSILLLLESIKRQPSRETQDILFDQISLLPESETIIDKIPVESDNFVISPDGKYEINYDGSLSGSVRLWEVESGKNKDIYDSSYFAGAVFSPDSKYLNIREYNSKYTVWSKLFGLKIGKFINLGSDHFELVEPSESYLYKDIAFSPDGKYLAVARDVSEPILELWNATTGKKIRSWSINNSSHKMSSFWARFRDDESQILKFSPNSRYFGIINHNSIQVFTVKDGKQVQIFTSNFGDFFSLVFSDDSQYISVDGEENLDQFSQVWDINTGEEILRLFDESPSTTPKIKSLGVNLDDKTLQTLQSDGVVRRWEISEKRERNIQHNDIVYNAAFSPDSQYLATISGSTLLDRGVGRLWNVNTGELMCYFWIVIQGWAVGIDGGNVFFSSTIKYLAVVSLPYIYIINLDTCGEVSTYQYYLNSSEKSEFTQINQENDNIITFVDDNKIQIIEPNGNKEEIEIDIEQIGKEDLYGIKKTILNPVSPNGAYSFSLKENKTGIIQEINSNSILMTFSDLDRLSSVSFSPNSMYFAMSSYDGTVKLINLEALENLIELEKLIEEGCRRLKQNLTRQQWSQYIGNKEPYRKTCPNFPEPKDPNSSE